MHKILLVIFSFLLFCSARAQTPSSCVAPQVLINYYTGDVAHLALQRIYQQGSRYKDSVAIPAICQDSIWQAMAAVFNDTPQPARDSVFNIYCIHQDVSYVVFHNIFVSVNTAYSWTQNWVNLQTTTGVPLIDSLLSTYSFAITAFTNFGGQPTATLHTPQNINIAPLCNAIDSIAGVVYAEGDPEAGGTNQLNYYTTDSARYLSFILGFGDCSSGCIDKYGYDFEVNTNCSVNYLGATKQIYTSDPFPVPINCNFLADTCHTTYSDLNKTICASDTFYVGNKPYTQEGNSMDTITNVGGCDSIVSLGLSIFPTSGLTAEYGFFCPGDTIIFDNKFYTDTGHYADTFENVYGCDSIRRITISSSPLAISILSMTYCDTTNDARNYTCAGYAYFIGSLTPDYDSIYWTIDDSLLNGNGQGKALFTYVGNNGIIEPGTTYLLPNKSHSICLHVRGGCNDTLLTVCDTFTITVTGVQPLAASNAMSIYPNPADDQLFIKTQGIHPETIIIYDINGRVISSLPFTPQMDVRGLSSGVYLLEVKNNTGITRQRFVKM